jgi:hypothetical protein
MNIVDVIREAVRRLQNAINSRMPVLLRAEPKRNLISPTVYHQNNTESRSNFKKGRKWNG